ncbi:hypothetical protein [Acidithiobacillus ferriphilus]|uniref:hypothetical protein n=1 Tax=Acidithiobacillus ferriphilus TaxID=1689834 RepID=UPI00232BF7CE|nr:hypothetical protein [Acidithiobacillus ferriphilus]WCE94366.1 hypothetical protein PJU76_02150 [Acidithiobacillus ferriphilus]
MATRSWILLLLDSRRQSLGALVILSAFACLTLAYGVSALPFFELGAFAAGLVVAEGDSWGWPWVAGIRAVALARTLRRAVPLLIGGVDAAGGSTISIRRRLTGFLAKRSKFSEKIQKIIDLRALLTRKFLRTPVLWGVTTPAPA